MARTRRHDRMRARKTTPAMRVYNSRQWKVAGCRRWPPPNMSAKVPAAPRRWSVLVAVTSITGDDCNKPGHWHLNRKIMRRCARRIIPSRPIGRLPRPEANPSAAVTLTAFRCPSVTRGFRMTGRGLKKSSGDGHSGGGKFPHVYLGFFSANLSQPAANPRQPYWNLC